MKRQARPRGHRLPIESDLALGEPPELLRRAGGLGQTRPVHVHTFTSVSRRGTTVEERLHELLEAKRALMNDFVVPMGSFDIAPDELVP